MRFRQRFTISDGMRRTSPMRAVSKGRMYHSNLILLTRHRRPAWQTGATMYAWGHLNGGTPPSKGNTFCVVNIVIS